MKKKKENWGTEAGYISASAALVISSESNCHFGYPALSPRSPNRATPGLAITRYDSVHFCA